MTDEFRDALKPQRRRRAYDEHGLAAAADWDFRTDEIFAPARSCTQGTCA